MRKWQQMRGIKYTCSTSHEPSIMMRNISLIQNSCAITALILIWSRLTYGTSCGRLCADSMVTFHHGFFILFLKKNQRRYPLGQNCSAADRRAFLAAIIAQKLHRTFLLFIIIFRQRCDLIRHFDPNLINLMFLLRFFSTTLPW